MKNIFKILSVGLFAILMMTTVANAKDGFYAGGDLSYVMQGDTTISYSGDGSVGQKDKTLEMEAGFGVSTVAGYSSSSMRYQFEYLSYKSDVGGDDDGYLKFDTMSVGVYKRFGSSAGIAPLFGIGVGSTTVSSDNNPSETMNAIYLAGGIEGKINDNLSFVAMLKMIKYEGYQIDNTQTETTTTVDFDMTTAIQGGVRYRFDF